MVKDFDYKLSDGILMPAVGLGTWQSSNEDAYNATLWALKAGYRHIDTAYVYQNEKGVGKAIKESGINRSDIFVVTKLPADIKTYDGAINTFNESLENLGLDYVDLYLIHAPWPWSNVGSNCDSGNVEAWKALIDLQKQGKIKSIGVSNFNEREIKNLIDNTNVKPTVNQIRFFVGNTQEDITKYCQANDILITAYSPMATGELLTNEEMVKLANKYNTTVSMVCLRYCFQRGCAVLPKSIHEERIVSNLDFNFEISDDDMNYLNSLYHIASTRPLRS